MAGYTIDTYERKKSESVAYRLRFYYSQNGEREYITETFDSEDAAEERAAELMLEYKKNGEFDEPSEKPFERLLDDWINHKVGSIGNSTQELYESVTRNHIKPELGKIPICDLTTSRLQRFIDGLKTDGRADGQEGGLSSSSIEDIGVVLKNSLDYAKRNELIEINPMKDVVIPTRSKSSQGKDQTFLTENQVAVFIKETRNTPPQEIRPTLITGVCTGMRQAEVCGLTWDNINLNDRILRITQQLKYSPYLGLEISDVKTESSRRTISMPSLLTECLKQWKSTQNEWKERVTDDKWNSYDRADDLDVSEHDFVFTDEMGNPIRPKRTYEWCKRIGQSNKQLPDDLTFHALRHTHASILIKNDESMKTVQTRLGHSEIGVTMNRYSHRMEGMDENASANFNKSIEDELSQLHEPENHENNKNDGSP